MKLYNHQQEIINTDPKKCGLFLGTGSGKTLTALCLARGRTLVICPKTQKEDGNWERENEKSKLKVDLTVVSKETFRRDAEELSAFDTVICDEVHTQLGVTPNVRYKNKKPIPKTSQIFEALDKYLERTKPSRLYLCTATIIRSPMTVWGAGKLLGIDWDFYRWRDTFYFRLPVPGREIFRAKDDDETKDKLAKLVRELGYVGRLEDFFDVPKQTYRTVYIDLTPKQKKRIQEMALEYPEPIVRVGKVHQIENGVLSGDEYSAPESFSNAKIDYLVDLAIEFPKMVVFAKYTAQIAQIATAMRGAGKKVLTLTGATIDRGQVILEAQKSTECVFIAQSQVSAGYELPDFPLMVFASMSWSIIDRIQGEGRILRANALKKNIYITLVARGGTDEAVFKCIENKKDFDSRIYLNI